MSKLSHLTTIFADVTIFLLQNYLTSIVEEATNVQIATDDEKIKTVPQWYGYCL